MLRYLSASVLLYPCVAGAVTVTGTVTDGSTPLQGILACGAKVDEQTRELLGQSPVDCAVTDVDGSFEVDTIVFIDMEDNLFGRVVVSAPGFMTIQGNVPMLEEGEEAVQVDVAEFLLEPLDTDNPSYIWWQAEDCGACHVEIHSQWAGSRHAGAATNAKVLQLYLGTDAQGNVDVAPGYKLEHDDAGPCGGCHAATASWTAGASVDLNDVRGVHRSGVFCETCHKIRAVEPNGEPGIDGSITMWRPSGDLAGGAGASFPFAFGPYADVFAYPMATSYSPLHKTAELCAGCHEYTNRLGVSVMDTYTSWKSISSTADALQCQDCHMMPRLNPEAVDPMEWVVDGHARMMYGVRRDPETVYPHSFFGGEDLMPYACSMEVDAFQEGNELVVKISVVNDGAGHSIPTGMPFREIILLAHAQEVGGDVVLEQIDGPTIPERGGDLAGRPGALFAMTLGDAAGNVSYAFWDATQVLDDTRLQPGQPYEAELRFEIPSDLFVVVQTKLIYRRFAQGLARSKGWETTDLYAVGHDVVREVKYAGCGCRGSQGGTVFLALGFVGLLAQRRRRA
ncbi:MAG: multiheme c-type cytochrome [Myxococcota bacterium]